MKTLFILRHAKSSWDNPDLSDFSRPLNERGLLAAPQIGTYLKQNAFEIDLILSSSAIRAVQTAMLVKESSGLQTDLQLNEKIYEASPMRLLRILSEVNDKIEVLLLVGHNPGLEDLVRNLSGEIHTLATATLIGLRLNIDKWSEIVAECGKVETVFRPEK